MAKNGNNKKLTASFRTISARSDCRSFCYDNRYAGAFFYIPKKECFCFKEVLENMVNDPDTLIMFFGFERKYG